MSERGPDRFPSTIWKDIQDARLDSTPEGVEAMNRFVSTYWRPVYQFLRAKGYSAERAEELTQEFMFQLMQRGWLRRANPERGRLRNFILRILIRFLADLGPQRAPRQKRFEQSFVSVSALVTEQDRGFDPPSGLTPGEIFDCQWAASLVTGVMQLLKLSYEAQDRTAWYDLFVSSYCFADEETKPTQDEMAKRFGITRDQVRYALEHTEQRFAQLLRAEIRCQLGETEDVEAEAREILTLARS